MKKVIMMMALMMCFVMMTFGQSNLSDSSHFGFAIHYSSNINSAAGMSTFISYDRVVLFFEYKAKTSEVEDIDYIYEEDSNVEWGWNYDSYEAEGIYEPNEWGNVAISSGNRITRDITTETNNYIKNRLINVGGGYKIPINTRFSVIPYAGIGFYKSHKTKTLNITTYEVKENITLCDDTYEVINSPSYKFIAITESIINTEYSNNVVSSFIYDKTIVLGCLFNASWLSIGIGFEKYLHSSKLDVNFKLGVIF